MTFEWYLNLAAALGILVLSIPIWQLNRNKKILQRLRDAMKIKDQSDCFSCAIWPTSARKSD